VHRDEERNQVEVSRRPLAIEEEDMGVTGFDIMKEPGASLDLVIGLKSSSSTAS
jgi:hypothetical protein